MVDIVEISAIVTAAGVLIGIVYYLLEMRNQTKIRQTDLIMRLYSDYRSNEFREAITTVMNLQFENYDDYVKKFGPWFSDEPAHKAIANIAMFFDGVGVLLYKKLTDESLIYDLFRPAIRIFWEKTKPVMLGLRRDYNDPKVYEWFEYLYNEMKKREQTLQQRSAKSG